MDAIENLLKRKSHPKLKVPAPNKEELQIILLAALRAPDHANLRPWRFDVYHGDALQTLGDALASAALASDPELDEVAIAKIKSKPARAPMVIVASALLQPHPKVPEVEQLLAVGAACQNILLAASALGYGAMWRTGGICYNPHLNQAMNWAENQKAVGFIYVGSKEGESRPVPSHDLSFFVTEHG